MAMKKCKECGEEISSSAKTCPKCGKKQKNGIVKIILIIFVIAFFAGIMAGDSENKTRTTLTSGSDVTNLEENNAKKEYNIGEIYEDKNIAIKYVAVDENFTGYSQYADVKNGYKIIKAEFEAENVGSSDELFSAYDFDCYADGYDCESFWSVENSGFSSTLSTGKKAKGSVYYQVPENSNEIKLEYKLNVWTSDKVVFVVK